MDISSPESPPSAEDVKPKGRRGVTKRVVTVPISEVEGSRLKGEGAPPADSWAWRKYGQKPIKGSPYPRGYYRCSSSKGCPARKQVERSRADPTMLIVTYASDHNHTARGSTSTSAAPAVVDEDEKVTPETTAATSGEDDGEFAVDLGDGMFNDEFGWFSAPRMDLGLRSPIWEGDGGVVVQMGEEDESLFADLGELPEFYGRRRGVVAGGSG